jgi:hypothetical protein
MKKIFLITLFVLLFTGVSKSSVIKKQKFPAILQMVTPVYPNLAIHLGLEEKILASIKIDDKGNITKVIFNRGDKNFHTVIEDALKRWKFEESSKKERKATINFIFTLLPNDSNSYVSSVFKSPNIIEIFARRIKVLDSTDR